MKAPSSALLLRATVVAATWLVLNASAQVPAPLQTQAADSRITQVKVYPGSATVERVARVAAGSRSVTFACLPAGLDVQSLQVSADASVRVGETSVLNEQRELSARCATSALDGRIRELEDQKAALQAESDALGMVTGYLKGLSGGDSSQGARAPMDARNLAAMTDAMRRTGQDSLLKQHQLARKQSDIDRQLNPLIAERTRSQGNGAQVVAVTVTLAASAEAEVKLSYQVNGPGWTPTYRALLDTTTRKVRIERQALVAQATGEDWRGVKLVLSTGQPRRETTGRTPGAWRIGIEPPPQRPKTDMAYMAAPAPAIAGAPPSLRESAMERRAPLFDVSVFDNSFATEFSVPQSIDVPSNGQRVTMALGQYEDTAKLASRTSPRVDASAFLVADLAQPTGVWPAGPMQLYRDGNFVGNGQWTAPSDARLTLSFGRDELVRVQAEPEKDNQGTGGFAGTRAERKVQRAYVVENRHRTPIAVQVLEAAPVSVDEQVRIASQFSPQPGELAWNKQPGLAMWSFDLDAGKTARVAADYTISYPKDARLQMR
ncbi:uncharacterized protein (TIGR02231 family) [Variovorax boronicumulans]|uniref:DUF4139 domain-containing protein n=1 Tax=Variovorax boronicumulans TaxID=436515 RepID=UPI00278A7615|nr:DUF4139 domain-containing protein [Variovorax boronicumulans]MDP9989586.1 uncharacterized protein (TIGR02231 family) [Variovorax boronicumulans]MDQ0007701.1 uncharacterized protein (TIGR02231 family) [Variovorax boronicumulans]